MGLGSLASLRSGGEFHEGDDEGDLGIGWMRKRGGRVPPLYTGRGRRSGRRGDAEEESREGMRLRSTEPNDVGPSGERRLRRGTVVRPQAISICRARYPRVSYRTPEHGNAGRSSQAHGPWWFSFIIFLLASSFISFFFIVLFTFARNSSFVLFLIRSFVRSFFLFSFALLFFSYFVRFI